MMVRGIDTTRDHVYPDLVFALPVTCHGVGDPRIVGVGVMAYHGNNEERKFAEEIMTSYATNIKRFVRWLIASGREVRLFTGDTCDDMMVKEILDDVNVSGRAAEASRVRAQRVSSFDELARAMAPVGFVVATRYHNIICALKLGKPAISLGYAAKNDVVMSEAGMSEFCQSASSLDVDKLLEQFMQLEERSHRLRAGIAERAAANVELLQEQFAELAMLVLSPRSGRLR
jgi:polysaccharide pyruvyl transferase WcaK-like protein